MENPAKLLESPGFDPTPTSNSWADLPHDASDVDEETNEIRSACQQCLGTLETLLSGPGVSAESAMFYRQMQGDAMRYQLEVTTDTAARAKLTSDALAAYTQATEGVDDAGLTPTNPVRLGLALNFAVFHHTALKEPKQAIQIARSALGNAVKDLDLMEEDSFAATTRSMRQLSDALRSWGAAPERGGLAPQPLATDYTDRERRREYGATSPRDQDEDEFSESADSASDD